MIWMLQCLIIIWYNALITLSLFTSFLQLIFIIFLDLLLCFDYVRRICSLTYLDIIYSMSTWAYKCHAFIVYVYFVTRTHLKETNTKFDVEFQMISLLIKNDILSEYFVFAWFKLQHLFNIKMFFFFGRLIIFW